MDVGTIGPDNGPSGAHDEGTSSLEVLHILLIEDDEHDRRLISRLVRQSIAECERIQITDATTLAEALAVPHHDISIILSDLNLPDSEGAHTIARLAVEFAGIPIVALTVDDERGVECIRAGAQDFVPKIELSGRALRRAIEFAVQRSAKTSEAEYLSRHDNLTGLLNRWAFEESVSRFATRSADFSSGVMALVIDVDNFKAVNDRYGHAAGDVVLKQVARHLQKATRADDLLCRIGGDEFALIAKVADERSAHELEHRTRQAMKFSIKLETSSSSQATAIDVSATVGSSYVPRGRGFQFEDLLQQADEAMYEQKRRRVPHARSGQ